MEIQIVGVNVINGEQVFHSIIDSSVEIPERDKLKYELLQPKTVYSYEELQEYQAEKQQEFNAKHPEGCSVFLSYRADPKTSSYIKKIEAAITDQVEMLSK